MPRVLIIGDMGPRGVTRSMANVGQDAGRPELLLLSNPNRQEQ